MAFKTFGKPKASKILGLCILVVIASPFMFRSMGHSIGYGIGFSVLWCSTVAIGFAIRLWMYKKELRAFKHGEDMNRRCHISMSKVIPNLDNSKHKKIYPLLEELITEHRMLWNRTNESYICFTNIFAEWPIKLLIEPIEKQGSRFNLMFSFSDRYMQPKMINWMKKRYQSEIDRIFECFRTSLLEAKNFENNQTVR